MHDKLQDNFTALVISTYLYVRYNKTSEKAQFIYRFNVNIENNNTKKSNNYAVLVDGDEGNTFIYGTTTKQANFVMIEGDGGNSLIGVYRYGEGKWKNRLLRTTRQQNKCITKNSGVTVRNAKNVNVSELFRTPSTVNKYNFRENCENDEEPVKASRRNQVC